MPNPTAAYDPDAAPWLKVLTAAETSAVLQEGFDVLDGRLLRTTDAAGRTPEELRAAVGIEAGERPFVDVVTLVPDRLTTIDDGTVARNRFPTGSCLVRIDPDGSRRLLTYYDGPAYGWRNGRGFADPGIAPGPSATYRGLRCAAALVPGDDDSIELVCAADEPPDGFAWARPGVCRAVVSIDDVLDLS